VERDSAAWLTSRSDIMWSTNRIPYTNLPAQVYCTVHALRRRSDSVYLDGNPTVRHCYLFIIVPRSVTILWLAVVTRSHCTRLAGRHRLHTKRPMIDSDIVWYNVGAIWFPSTAVTLAPPPPSLFHFDDRFFTPAHRAVHTYSFPCRRCGWFLFCKNRDFFFNTGVAKSKLGRVVSELLTTTCTCYEEIIVHGNGFKDTRRL